MPRIAIICFVFICICFPHFAYAEKINRVLYITLDGVRWQDFFSSEHFPKLWGIYLKEVTIYGLPKSNSKIEVASIPVSLPSYQSQMSGAVQPCAGNNCRRISVETLPEALVHKLNLPQKDVATFSSWYKLDYAVEHKPGTTYVNVGNCPVNNHQDGIVMDLNQKQTFDHPPGLNRFDKYTFKHAMRYFELNHPRFLWISLVDADNAAHLGLLSLYHQVLDFYDDVIDEVFKTLKRLNMDKDTLVIVTTDHGRGDGCHWTDHGPEYPESKQTWAFVLNGALKPIKQDGDVSYYNTLSIRPTIEAALGA